MVIKPSRLPRELKERAHQTPAKILPPHALLAPLFPLTGNRLKLSAPCAETPAPPALLRHLAASARHIKQAFCHLTETLYHLVEAARHLAETVQTSYRNHFPPCRNPAPTCRKPPPRCRNPFPIFRERLTYRKDQNSLAESALECKNHLINLSNRQIR